MSWNIEIAVIDPCLQDPTTLGLIDVLTDTGKDVPFWDASSSQIGNAICVGHVGDKTVIIDINCRLLSASKSLLKDAGNRKVVFCRVANEEICVEYRNQKRYEKNWFSSLFFKDKVDSTLDGEQRAWKYLESTTGINQFSDTEDNLNNASFRVYEFH